ncbi:MAG: porin [Pseudomonadota bacterium]
MLKRNNLLVASAAVVATSLVSLPAQAGVKLKDEKSGIVVDLGGRLQVQTLFNDDDFIQNNDTEFKVRRARFRLGIAPHPWWKMFLQTDFSNEAGTGSGGDVRLIDANITFKPHNLSQIVGGLHMAPVARQNLTSSGGLMAIDRPGITNYVLTWGLNGRARFNNSTLPGTNSGSVGDVAVRDLGLTLFGSGSASDTLHYKYYLGVADGSTKRQGDDNRFSVRAQLNYGDAEPGYFGLSTYLGKKQTIGVGIGYDTQDSIAAQGGTGGADVDYTFITIDAFADWPVGPGFVTAEAAYSTLDLNDATNPLVATPGEPSTDVNADQSQGDGLYVQAGYLINNWQPWIGYEQWDADAANNAGDWDGFRVGVSYFFKGHNANVKLGYEKISNDTPGEVDIDTILLGAYITY